MPLSPIRQPRLSFWYGAGGCTFLFRNRAIHMQSPAFHMLFDATGTYTAAIIVAAIIGFLAVPLALWLPPHERGGRPIPVLAPAT